MGKGVHRSGWPYILEHMQPDGDGNLLDDCVEATFLFRPEDKPHKQPWVGIFHFPHDVIGPLEQDYWKNSAQALVRKPLFQRSRRYLKAGIALCTDLSIWLRCNLHVPVLVLKHPTQLDVRQWCGHDHRVLQVGWHLRNTRCIFHVPPVKGWRFERIAPMDQWQHSRDKGIRLIQPREPNRQVNDIARLDDAAYDDAMASSIVIMEAWGAAANNVVVECIARGTPLLVNRLPAIVEYLGEDYCFYFDRHDKVPAMITDPARVCEAHHQVIARRGDWMDCQLFADKIKDWVDAH